MDWMFVLSEYLYGILLVIFLWSVFARGFSRGKRVVYGVMWPVVVVAFGLFLVAHFGEWLGRGLRLPMNGEDEDYE